jgi:hypothetical protein
MSWHIWALTHFLHTQFMYTHTILHTTLTNAYCLWQETASLKHSCVKWCFAEPNWLRITWTYCAHAHVCVCVCVHAFAEWKDYQCYLSCTGYIAVNRRMIINNKLQWMWHWDWLNKIMNMPIMITNLHTSWFMWNFLSALVIQHWQWHGTKWPCTLRRYCENFHPHSLSTATDLWPEGGAAGAVVADRLCFDPCSPQYSRLPINKYFFQPLSMLHQPASIWATAFWIMEGRCNCASPACGQVHTVTLAISSLFINAKLNTNLQNSRALWKPIRLPRQLKTTKYRLITIWRNEASCTDATGWYKVWTVVIRWQLHVHSKGSE